MKFKLPKGTTMHSILFKLDCLACKEDVWVRIINEKDKDYECFSSYCNALERSYKNIKFYGGYNKKDGNSYIPLKINHLMLLINMHHGIMMY